MPRPAAGLQRGRPPAESAPLPHHTNPRMHRNPTDRRCHHHSNMRGDRARDLQRGRPPAESAPLPHHSNPRLHRNPTDRRCQHHSDAQEELARGLQRGRPLAESQPGVCKGVAPLQSHSPLATSHRPAVAPQPDRPSLPPSLRRAGRIGSGFAKGSPPCRVTAPLQYDSHCTRLRAAAAYREMPVAIASSSNTTRLEWL